MEVLIAVLLIAIVALVGLAQANKAMKRARLDGAQRDVQSIAQRAGIEMKMRGVATFLEVSRGATGWQLRLWADADGSGTLDTTKDTLVQTLALPSDIVLSTTNAAAIESVNWSGTKPNPADASSRYLICDLLSRTLTADASAPPVITQLQAVATLELLQQDMLPLTAPVLSPPIKYELRIGPVWNPSIQRYRVLNASASPATWSPI